MGSTSLVLAQAPTTTTEPPVVVTLREIASNPLTPVIAIVVAGLIIWFGWAMLGKHRGNDAAIEAVARKHGLRYLSSDPGVGQIRLQLFGGEQARVHNVLCADDGDGTECKAFEYVGTRMVTKQRTDTHRDGGIGFGPRLGTGSNDSGGLLGALGQSETYKVRQSTGKRRTGGIAKVPAYLPRMVIAAENTLSRIADPIGAADVQTESDEFNHMFDVRSENREFALAILDARMIDFMLDTGGNIAFETFGHWLCCSMDRVSPDQLPGVIRLMSELKRRIPPLVVNDYPLPSLVEEMSRPPAGYAPSHYGNNPK